MRSVIRPTRTMNLLMVLALLINLTSCGGGGGSGVASSDSTLSDIPSGSEAQADYQNEQTKTAVTNTLAAYSSIDAISTAAVTGLLTGSGSAETIALIENSYIAPLQIVETALNRAAAIEEGQNNRSAEDVRIDEFGGEVLLWVGLLSAAAAVGGMIKYASDKMAVCKSFSSTSAEHWQCLVELMVDGGSNKVIEAVASTHPGNPLNNAPEGIIQILVEGAQIPGKLESVKQAAEVIGTRCGAANTDRTFREAPTDPGSVLIGRTDENGMLNNVPEGEWTFGFFNDGAVRLAQVCVAVKEGKTTVVSWVPVPVSDSGGTTTGGGTDGDTGGNNGCLLNDASILGNWSNPRTPVASGMGALDACTYTFNAGGTGTKVCTVLGTQPSFTWDGRCNEVDVIGGGNLGNGTWSVTSATTMEFFESRFGVSLVMTKN